MAGQSIAVSAGALTAATSMTITALSASFASGTLAVALDIALIGQSATFTPGTLTVPGDVTVSITGLTATFAAGVMSIAPIVQDTHDGGTQVVRASHYRKILRLKPKPGALERADRVAEAVLPLTADRRIVQNKVIDDEAVLMVYLTQEADEMAMIGQFLEKLLAQET
jgi:hypothetical protein